MTNNSKKVLFDRERAIAFFTSFNILSEMKVNIPADRSDAIEALDRIAAQKMLLMASMSYPDENADVRSSLTCEINQEDNGKYIFVMRTGKSIMLKIFAKDEKSAKQTLSSFYRMLTSKELTDGESGFTLPIGTNSDEELKSAQSVISVLRSKIRRLKKGHAQDTSHKIRTIDFLKKRVEALEAFRVEALARTAVVKGGGVVPIDDVVLPDADNVDATAWISGLSNADKKIVEAHAKYRASLAKDLRDEAPETKESRGYLYRMAQAFGTVSILFILAVAITGLFENIQAWIAW